MERTKPTDLREWSRVELIEEVRKLQDHQDQLLTALATYQRKERINT